MTASGKALSDSLLPDMKQAVAALAAAWQSHRARRIEPGLLASLPEVSNDEDDPTMEMGFEYTTPDPVPVCAGFTMEQAHFDAVMAEEQSVSVFQQA